MKNDNKLEDFIFSAEELYRIALDARDSKKNVARTYINGKEFTSKIESGTTSRFEDAKIVVGNVIGASENNPDFLITTKEELGKETLYQVAKNIMGLSFFIVNPYLTIQVLQNTNDEIDRLIPLTCFVVKIIDRMLNNKETIFIMNDHRDLFIEVNTTTYATFPTEKWNKCYEQREFLNFYEGNNLYEALIQDCQKNYEKILKQQETIVES
ncbi:MAG: hypothetical protein NTZ44_04110 [Candidatus Nomurabacteria bacterium]|nr:hypothetical protein [Candidatus Nomurabacteria bacterium]